METKKISLKDLLFSEQWEGSYKCYGKTFGWIKGWRDRKNSFTAVICGDYILEQGSYKACCKALEKINYKKQLTKKGGKTC